MRLLQIDAFTDRPFSGNPAAVCLLETPASPQWMQQVAAEMNLSETAFVYLLDAQIPNRYSLRWFTPTVEMDLCGHATLATAHALWREGWAVPEQPLYFETRSGTLVATQSGDWICLDFPAIPTQPVSSVPPDLLLGLGLKNLPFAVVESALGYLVEVDSAATVAHLTPDFNTLYRLGVTATIVTAAGRDPYDFTSRFFAPNIGIPEDPVTGSAHCCLATYWHQRLDKTDFFAYQASARGGILQVHYDEAHRRVFLRGQGVVVLEGNLLS
jgi:PhzF family phenazine biosynthesis protein